ncbi:MAG: hypothetical protein FJZ00_05815 [Candidatus Sericytochromatia bacterium]|uniref:Uncharacterized protein n=1 Tax=Candidatus Tanganyikabacteria bacterium TaxID=2961651 RepID=A0A937X265_9BACT|nr:hypothetical protein [Candidatus Tanganyikabacteria bacterium]
MNENTWPSTNTDLGKRFRAACKRRKMTITAAAREMGYAFAQSIYPILAGRPGFRGREARGRIERWISRRMT